MPAPTPPNVPPPALRSDPATFPDRAESNITFFGTLVTYIANVTTWITSQTEAITAIAMAGDLPSLTGRAGQLLQVTDTEQLGFQAADTYAPAIQGVPTAAISAFMRDTAPAGWLAMDGSEISRTTYADLYAAIGDVGGAGDGSTTFDLPDMRGEFLRGWDDGRGVDAGRVFGSSQADEFRAHTHTQSSAGAVSNFSGGAFAHLINTGNTGSAGGDETRPRNIAILYCIKF